MIDLHAIPPRWGVPRITDDSWPLAVVREQV